MDLPLLKATNPLLFQFLMQKFAHDIRNTEVAEGFNLRLSMALLSASSPEQQSNSCKLITSPTTERWSLKVIPDKQCLWTMSTALGGSRYLAVHIFSILHRLNRTTLNLEQKNTPKLVYLLFFCPFGSFLSQSSKWRWISSSWVFFSRALFSRAIFCTFLLILCKGLIHGLQHIKTAEIGWLPK